MAKKIALVSLGCPKALVDSELMVTQLRARGYVIGKDTKQAALVLINTCGFIDDAVEESLQSIASALNDNGKVIVTGCLGSRNGAHGGEAMIRERFPSLLGITGPHAADEVMALVDAHLPMEANPFNDLVPIPKQGIKLTPKHYAYLKISEGCNHHCTFCIIPSMRGKLASRPMGEVLTEAESLAQAGVKELLVIAQDTSAYGVDKHYLTGFWQGRPLRTHITELTKQLGQLFAGRWLRLHYVYPYPHVDELVELMAQGRVLPYLDVPFQHADPEVLKRMSRPANGEKNLARIEKWRSICPGIALRSTFIVGFPGETEVGFENLLSFIREAELDRVGCFAYSDVKGASANALDGHLPMAEREARRKAFMQVAEQVSVAKLHKRVGKVMQVLVDRVERGAGIGRSFADAPEIDGQVFIEAPTRASKRLKVGEFVKVLIQKAQGHDLIGSVV